MRNSEPAQNPVAGAAKRAVLQLRSLRGVAGRQALFPADDPGRFRHLGGGPKGLFILLRYVFIIATAYVLLYEARPIVPEHALMIAVALASNVGLSLAPRRLVFSWYVEAPILIADTMWVSWALQTTGRTGQEFLLLYFFVLFLALAGESLFLVVLSSTVVSAANVYTSLGPNGWTSAQLLRITFFYSVALFYGHVVSQIKRERQRADRGLNWARELEERVAERTKQLSHLYEVARESSRLKSEFMATVSHELRTPLHIIIGYAEVLLDGAVVLEAGDRDAMLRRILTAAREQTDMVNAVLDFGKVEAGRMPVQWTPLRLDRFVSVLQTRERLPLAPGVQLTWCVEPDLPVIETDAGKLTTIVDNLINNAIKFTTNGSIRVGIRAERERQQVEVRVDDTGPGIPTHDLAFVFEAFRQLDGSQTRRHNGLGLGLAIVQRYVELLRGHIVVRSSPGAGSSFVVRLPYRGSGAPAAANAINAARLASAASAA
jgi:signal transduction histidine kinase